MALAALAPAAAIAQMLSAAVVIGVEDSAKITRAGASSSAPVSSDDIIYFGDRLETGDHARLRLRLGFKGVLTLNERTVVRLTPAPNVTTIELIAGAVLLNLAGSRMDPGEMVDVTTQDASVQSRGNTVIAEVSERASRFTVKTGMVDVLPFDADGLPATAARLGASETRVVLGSVGPAPAGPPQAQAPAASHHGQRLGAPGRSRPRLRIVVGHCR